MPNSTCLEAVRVAFDPTPTQERLLYGHAGAARFVFNAGLAHVKDCMERGVKPEWSFYGLRKWWNASKNALAVNREGVPWWGAYSKEAYSYGLECLAAGLKNFSQFKQGKRQGRRVGFPRFKSKHGSRLAFAYTTGSFGLIDGDPHALKLPKVGRVHCFENVERRVGCGRVLRMTVSCVGGRWMASLTVERETPPQSQQRANRTGGIIGVDLGISALATLSDGTAVENPRALKRNLSRLKNAQRALSRKQQGSRRREQARQRVTRLHARVANLRSDRMHKLTHYLTTAYSVVGLEDLNVSGMMRNHNLAQAVADASFFELRRQVEYKTVKHGSAVRYVDRYYASSKTCSHCGAVKTKLPLSERTYHCQHCGNSIDRDLNAANNIAMKVAVSATETLNAHGEQVRPLHALTSSRIMAQFSEVRTKQPYKQKCGVRLGADRGNAVMQA